GGARLEGRDANHGRYFPRIQGVSARLLDCRRSDAGAGLRDCRPDFSRAGSRWNTNQHADRSAAVSDPRSAVVECTGVRTGRRRLMKYILMMHGQKSSWDEYARWSREDLQRNVEFIRRFNEELHDSGVCVDTKGLA